MAKETSTKAYSTKQEKLIAKILGGKVVPASGARLDPGDVSSYEWLAECKTHTEPGHTIFFDIDVWKKICNEAMAVHRKPVLIVDDGSQKEENTWCLCKEFNLNLGKTLTLDLPVTIRKNISAKHEKLQDALKPIVKKYVGEFYNSVCFSVNWNNEDVCIIPLSFFKEVCDN